MQAGFERGERDKPRVEMNIHYGNRRACINFNMGQKLVSPSFESHTPGYRPWILISFDKAEKNKTNGRNKKSRSSRARKHLRFLA
jgi:hypothetical protein